jgi:glycosyltransferase involved in cell wall biosynthesis
MKICFWTTLPNHYQRSFVKALSKQCDLQVNYFEQLPPERVALGWKAEPALMGNEHRCSKLGEALASISDWRERVHLVPSYGGSFQRSLARHLVKHKTDWVDWSEASSPGWKWLLRYPVKAWWTTLVNNHALGSFSIGNRAERDFAKRGIRRSRIAFLPYVSETPSPQPPDSIITEFARTRKAFLFLGSLNHRKGIDLLLRAMAQALSNSSEWVLVIVGADLADGTYQRTAEQLRLTGKVLFRGAVNPDHLPAVLAASKVLVLPSRRDGWGVAMNEAVLSGLAIVASHVCGAGEHLIIPGRNGFRFAAGSAQQLAEVLNLYTHNQGLAEEHGHASRRLASLIDPATNAAAMLSTIRAWRASRVDRAVAQVATRHDSTAA